MSTEAVTPQSPANPEHTKVFIGNLAFATREEALTKAFEDLGIKLHSVNVVVKRGRSMGYGFVEIDDKDYQTAFEKLHKSQLDSRTINLEKATSTNSNKQVKRPRKPRQKKKVPAKTGSPASTPAAAKPATEQPAATGGDKPAAPKKKKNNRRKKPAAASSGNAKPAEGQPTVVENASGAPASAPAAKKPRTRKPKPPASTQKREHSGTELYVANIPFTLTDDELKQEFSQFGCVSATVIINSYGKNKGKSNRGYGFVKVDTEDNQKAAIEQDKKLKIGGRDISIKPAFVRTEPVKPDEAPKDSEAKAEAPKEAPKAEAPKSEEAKKE